MTHAVADLGELSGAELVDALERRFTTSTETVRAGGQEISILRPRNSDDLIREEDFALDERLPYWADIWPASTVLATHFVTLSSRRHSLSAKRGLELGCGVGLVSVAAMLAGYDMTSTDYYTDALAFTRANAWRNTAREPETRMIDWRTFPEDTGVFDLILASDVLYEKEYARLLPGIFARTLAPGGMAVVADPGRIGVPEFREACTVAGLVIRSKTSHPFDNGTVSQQIDLYEIADTRS